MFLNNNLSALRSANQEQLTHFRPPNQNTEPKTPLSQFFHNYEVFNRFNNHQLRQQQNKEQLSKIPLSFISQFHNSADKTIEIKTNRESKIKLSDENKDNRNYNDFCNILNNTNPHNDNLYNNKNSDKNENKEFSKTDQFNNHYKNKTNFNNKTKNENNNDNNNNNNSNNTNIESCMEDDDENDDDGVIDDDDDEVDDGGSGERTGEEKRRKKKTRTVFSRSQVFQLESTFDVKRYVIPFLLIYLVYTYHFI